MENFSLNIYWKLEIVLRFFSSGCWVLSVWNLSIQRTWNIFFGKRNSTDEKENAIEKKKTSNDIRFYLECYCHRMNIDRLKFSLYIHRQMNNCHNFFLFLWLCRWSFLPIHILLLIQHTEIAWNCFIWPFYATKRNHLFGIVNFLRKSTPCSVILDFTHRT